MSAHLSTGDDASIVSRGECHVHADRVRRHRALRLAPFRLSPRRTAKRGARANLAVSLLFVAYVIVMLSSLAWHGVQPSAGGEATTSVGAML